MSGTFEFLFVYGSLRRGSEVEMAGWLAAVGEFVGAARARGRLYDLGAYPALLELRSKQRVLGDLYRLPRGRGVLPVLDRYEGGPPGRACPPFIRVRRKVDSERYGRVSAWLYLYRRPVAGCRWLRSGDYMDVLHDALAPSSVGAASSRDGR